MSGALEQLPPRSRFNRPLPAPVSWLEHMQAVDEDVIAHLMLKMAPCYGGDGVHEVPCAVEPKASSILIPSLVSF